MSVKTFKEKEKEQKIKVANKATLIKKDKIDNQDVLLYLKSVKEPGKYTCYIETDKNQEAKKVIVKDGFLKVDKKDVGFYLNNGFMYADDLTKELTIKGIMYNPDYIGKDIELELSNKTKVKIEKGKVEPKNNYERKELIRLGFKQHSLDVSV